MSVSNVLDRLSHLVASASPTTGEDRKRQSDSEVTKEEDEASALTMSMSSLPNPEQEEYQAHQRRREEALQRLYKGVIIKTRRYHLRKYKKCFVGSQAVDYMIESGWAKYREEAVEIGRQLQQEFQLFEHVVHPQRHPFKDEELFYRFNIAADNETSTSYTNEDDDDDDDSSSEYDDDTDGSEEDDLVLPTTTSLKEGDTRGSVGSRRSSLGSSSHHYRFRNHVCGFGLIAMKKILEEVVPSNYNTKYDKDGFMASEAINTMISIGLASSRREAIQIGRSMEHKGYIRNPLLQEESSSATNKHHQYLFNDRPIFYCFMACPSKPAGVITPFQDGMTWREQLTHVKKVLVDTIQVRDLVYHFKTYKDCFLGSDVIDILVVAQLAASRNDAIHLGRCLVYEYHLLHHVTYQHELEDNDLFYRFSKITRQSSHNEPECHFPGATLKVTKK